MGDHCTLDEIIFQIQVELFLFLILEVVDKIPQVGGIHLAG